MFRTKKTYFAISFAKFFESNCVVVCFRTNWALKTFWDDVSTIVSIVRDFDACVVDRRKIVIVTNCCAEKSDAHRKIAYIASEIITFDRLKKIEASYDVDIVLSHFLRHNWHTLLFSRHLDHSISRRSFVFVRIVRTNWNDDLHEMR
jgi:hypothetical protein